MFSFFLCHFYVIQFYAAFSCTVDSLTRFSSFFGVLGALGAEIALLGGPCTGERLKLALVKATPVALFDTRRACAAWSGSWPG